MKTYAGIGSRRLPTHLHKELEEVASILNDLGYFLNSGGAEGCDEVFEAAASSGTIYLPWDGFREKHHGDVKAGLSYVVPPYREVLVRKFHPNVRQLKASGWKFMSRNSYQVLGYDLKSPVDFVVCWTPSGKDEGGTAQACRIARSMNIPVYNLNDVLENTAIYSMLRLMSFEQ